MRECGVSPTQMSMFSFEACDSVSSPSPCTVSMAGVS